LIPLFRTRITRTGLLLIHPKILPGSMLQKRSLDLHGIKVSLKIELSVDADIQLHTIRPVSLALRRLSILLVSSLASLKLIIGSNIAIYGAGTSYTITIDPSSQQPHTETITGGRNETGRNVLYSTNALTFSPHTIEITNEGDFLLLDLLEFGVDAGGIE